MNDPYDLIVIGAGWYGLAVAKTYLELHPTNRLLVLDSAESCGGTWSAERLYPQLKSNNLWGSFEYPDFPMQEETYGVRENQHIPGEVLHAYLCDYARAFGILELIQFRTRVLSVSQYAMGWDLTVDCKPGLVTMTCRKLVLATGLTSQPNMPIFAGRDDFQAPLYHVKDFALNESTVKTCQKVVVVGGAKSAFDVAYAYAREGVMVNMIIRPDGKGPVWLAPAHVTPLKRKVEELVHTRLLTWVSPGLWGGEGMLGKANNWLHKSMCGRWIVRRFWSMLGSEVMQRNAYDSNAELKKLKPWYNPFWSASSISILNYDEDVLEMVRIGRIRIHIASISSLGRRTVNLENGQCLAADALVCATGWQAGSGIQFVDFSTDACSEEERQHLTEEADREVLAQFPELKTGPSFDRRLADQQGSQLYRFIVPPTSFAAKNIAFAGAVSTVSTSFCAAVQALWICAHFDDELSRIPENQADVVYEALLGSRWCRWRYPCGYGPRVPDLGFDILPYLDVLMGDLGLCPQRKSGLMADLLSPYKPWDYRTIVAEYQKRLG